MRNFFWILILLAFPLNAAAEVKIIELKHRAATDIVAQVKSVLDESEKVEAAGHHLILVADGESLQAAEKLIELLDTKQRNIRVRIRQTRDKLSSSSDVDSEVRLSSETGVSGSSRLSVRRGNALSTNEHSLNMIEGHSGFLEIGRNIPFTEQWATLAGDIQGYSETVSYKLITTGFWVMPVRVFDEYALVDVEPFFADVVNSNTQKSPEIVFSQLKTRLKVPLAQWYPLGQQMMHRDKVSRAIVSWSANNSQSSEMLEIRIEPTE